SQHNSAALRPAAIVQYLRTYVNRINYMSFANVQTPVSQREKDTPSGFSLIWTTVVIDRRYNSRLVTMLRSLICQHLVTRFNNPRHQQQAKQRHRSYPE